MFNQFYDELEVLPSAIFRVMSITVTHWPSACPTHRVDFYTSLDLHATPRPAGLPSRTALCVVDIKRPTTLTHPRLTTHDQATAQQAPTPPPPPHHHHRRHADRRRRRDPACAAACLLFARLHLPAQGCTSSLRRLRPLPLPPCHRGPPSARERISARGFLPAPPFHRW